MKPFSRPWVVASLLVSAPFPIASALAAEGPRTVYISTGDNQWVLWLPMDSPATIDAAFDSLHRNFAVDRVLWRGAQDDLWFRTHRFREQNRFYSLLWGWMRYLVEQVGTNRAAIESARRRAMSIWAVNGLFEFACQADAGGCTDYPYQSEDKLRVEHPEWIPVNRYGTRLQAGPIEYAYPEARRAVVERWTRFLVEQGYDGMAFYTYVENFNLRYPEEFGYNQPVVDEFKRRYGVDIRVQPFNKTAWARLRGEYVTQLLREMHASFARHGKKIAVFLDPENMDLPQPWRPANEPEIRTAGRIHMDWKRWAKEGIVDELIVYWHPSEELRYQAAERVLAATEGSGCRVSMFMTVGDIDPRLTRVLFPGEEVALGFGWDNHIGWPTEKTEPQPLSALNGDDAYAKRRVLYMISQGKQHATLADVLPATRDEDVYVRRLALEALRALKDPAAVPAVEAALGDPENSVRCMAAVVLADLHGPDSLGKILEVLRTKFTFQFGFSAAPQALAAIGPKNMDALVAAASDADVNVRRVVLRVLQSIAKPDMQNVRDALLTAVRDDADPYCRELALGALAQYARDPEVVGAMLAALSDKDEVVQVRAARYLAESVAGQEPADTARQKAFDALLALFRKYGDGCRRSDADWGWRVVGNALLLLQPEGEAALKGLITQKDDRRLAELAWHVVYIRQKAMSYCPVTEQHDREAHGHYPAREHE